MGLAIRRSIVAALRRLHVDGKLNARRRHLSIYHASAAKRREKTDTTTRSGEAVFIVDDDASICEGLCNLLESVGIRAACYSSPKQSWKAERYKCRVHAS